jgi:hypothetical protein
VRKRKGAGEEESHRKARDGRNLGSVFEREGAALGPLHQVVIQADLTKEHRSEAREQRRQEKERTLVGSTRAGGLPLCALARRVLSRNWCGVSSIRERERERE